MSKKRELIFGIMMCLGMVTIMLSYNIILARGFTSEALMIIAMQFIPTLIAAFVIEELFVGHNAQRLLKRVTARKTKTTHRMLLFGIIMVVSMCLSMSCYVTLITHGTADFWANFSQAVVRNLPVALVAQLLIVGPSVRALFPKVMALTQKYGTRLVAARLAIFAK